MSFVTLGAAAPLAQEVRRWKVAPTHLNAQAHEEAHHGLDLTLHVPPQHLGPHAQHALGQVLVLEAQLARQVGHHLVGRGLRFGGLRCGLWSVVGRFAVVCGGFFVVRWQGWV